MLLLIALGVRAALYGEADRSGGGGKARLNLTDLANPLHHLEATRCTVELHYVVECGELVLKSSGNCGWCVVTPRDQCQTARIAAIRNGWRAVRYVIGATAT